MKMDVTGDDVVDDVGITLGTYGGKTYIDYYAGLHEVQGIEFTFWSDLFPDDFTRAVRKYQLRLQFPPFSVSLPAFATLNIRRWDDAAYTVTDCIGGATISGDGFDIQGLWPRDYFFSF
jgi:hypothetical protein